MWPLSLAIVLGRQAQLQRVGGPEGDWLREGSLRAKPAGEKTLLAFRRPIPGSIDREWTAGAAHFSLRLSPAFFAAIWTVPSSNPQAEAACATPAASSRRAGAIDCVSRIVDGF